MTTQLSTLSLTSKSSAAERSAFGEYLIALGTGLCDGTLAMQDEAKTADEGMPEVVAHTDGRIWGVGIDANFVLVAPSVLEGASAEDLEQLAEIRALKLQLAQPDSCSPEAARECREILRETGGMYRKARLVLEARLADPFFEADQARNREAINLFKIFEAECNSQTLDSVN